MLTFDKEGKIIKISEQILILIKIGGSMGVIPSNSYRPVNGRDAVKELINSDHVSHTLEIRDGNHGNEWLTLVMIVTIDDNHNDKIMMMTMTTFVTSARERKPLPFTSTASQSSLRAS